MITACFHKFHVLTCWLLLEFVWMFERESMLLKQKQPWLFFCFFIINCVKTNMFKKIKKAIIQVEGCYLWVWFIYWLFLISIFYYLCLCTYKQISSCREDKTTTYWKNKGLWTQTSLLQICKIWLWRIIVFIFTSC